MKKIISGVLLLLSFHVWNGCGSVPPTYYYRIDYEIENSANQNHPVPASLGIVQFSADALYETDKIVYRHSPYEVQFYHYRRWVAPPKKIVTEHILEQFKSSGVFEAVVRIPSATQVDYILGGDIQAFEEWDEKEAWFGIVTIEFRLVDAQTQEVVWQQVLSGKTEAAEKEPVAVVEAISKSLKKVVQEAIPMIKQNLKDKNI